MMADRRVVALHEDLTGRIIGAAMAVHRRLGPGEREFIYQRAMEAELDRLGLAYAAEIPVEVCDGDRLLGYYIPDLVVELKAAAAFRPGNLGQVITYLNHLGLPIGLLINFGERSLAFRRVFPSPPATEFRINRQYLITPRELEREPRHGVEDRDSEHGLRG